MLDIRKIKELLGWGDEKSEDLEAAMEKQILPEAPPSRPEHSPRQAASRRDAPLLDLAGQSCAWCNRPCQPEKDGFHLVHVAFGTTQERHCFCSDDCYEAFRRMYPSRVHRNCYETPCAECTFCVRRYVDESDARPAGERDVGTMEKG